VNEARVMTTPEYVRFMRGRRGDNLDLVMHGCHALNHRMLLSTDIVASDINRSRSILKES
jgi:hypothetical protein